MRIIVIAAALLGLLAGAACAAAAPPASRQEVLVNLTDTVIVPRFQATAAGMNRLKDALHALCDSPGSATLDGARAAWREARAPWMRSQAMWFGPVMERRSRSLVDWWPVEPERIEAMLAERDAVTAGDVREFLASTQRGLGAIEYVIFGDDGAVLAALEPAGGVRCQYLTALGEVAAAEMDGVVADWTGVGSDRAAYAGYFNGTAASSLLAKAAVDEAVRHSVFLTRSITDMRLGAALGADGGAPDPEAIPGGAGGNAVADMRNQLLGMRDIYDSGGAGPGLSALVRGISPEAEARMTAGFSAALAAIDGLAEPLAATIADNPEPAWQAHRRLQDFQRALNTEVVSLLGVSVGFADTDGDGG